MCRNRILLRMRSRLIKSRGGSRRKPTQHFLGDQLHRITGCVDDRADIPLGVKDKLRRDVNELLKSIDAVEEGKNTTSRLGKMVERISRFNRRAPSLEALVSKIGEKDQETAKNLLKRLAEIARYREAAGFLVKCSRQYSIFRNVQVVPVSLDSSQIPHTAVKAAASHGGPRLSRILHRINAPKSPRSLHLPENAMQLGTYFRQALTATQVHAEIQIALYYDMQALSSGSSEGEGSDGGVLHHPPRVVAASKESCFLCHEFLKSHAKLVVPGCHGRLYTQWKLPVWTPKPQETEDFNRVLELLAREKLRKGIKRKRELPAPAESLLRPLSSIESMRTLNSGGGDGGAAGGADSCMAMDSGGARTHVLTPRPPSPQSSVSTNRPASVFSKPPAPPGGSNLTSPVQPSARRPLRRDSRKVFRSAAVPPLPGPDVPAGATGSASGVAANNTTTQNTTPSQVRFEHFPPSSSPASSPNHQSLLFPFTTPFAFFHSLSRRKKVGPFLEPHRSSSPPPPPYPRRPFRKPSRPLVSSLSRRQMPISSSPLAPASFSPSPSPSSSPCICTRPHLYTHPTLSSLHLVHPLSLKQGKFLLQRLEASSAPLIVSAGTRLTLFLEVVDASERTATYLRRQRSRSTGRASSSVSTWTRGDGSSSKEKEKEGKEGETEEEEQDFKNRGEIREGRARVEGEGGDEDKDEDKDEDEDEECQDETKTSSLTALHLRQETCQVYLEWLPRREAHGVLVQAASRVDCENDAADESEVTEVKSVPLIVDAKKDLIAGREKRILTEPRRAFFVRLDNTVVKIVRVGI